MYGVYGKSSGWNIFYTFGEAFQFAKYHGGEIQIETLVNRTYTRLDGSKIVAKAWRVIWKRFKSEA